MNIILGKQAAEKLQDSYTILELETFTRQDGSAITAYCVIESVPISELPILLSNIKLHENFIREYNNKNYKYCEDAVEHLLVNLTVNLTVLFRIIGRIKLFKLISIS